MSDRRTSVADELAELRRLEAEIAKRRRAAEEADRELAAQRRAARLEAHDAYRRHVVESGGLDVEQDKYAAEFLAAVREADGAAALSAWLKWRFEGRRVLGMRMAMQEHDAETRAARGDRTRRLPLSAYHPAADFPGDLHRAAAVVEAERQAAGSAEVAAFVRQYVDEHTA